MLFPCVDPQRTALGDAITYQHLVQHGGDFTLHEFALRAWLACEAGCHMGGGRWRLR